MSKLHRAALGGLSFVALGLASCSTQRPAPRPRPAPGPVIAPPARGLDGASYVATAASIDLFVVRASDLALKRSSNARIRALATRLGEEHRGLAGQLSFAGRRINRLPAARLLPREKQRLSALDTPPFDGIYVSQMVLTHEQSLALHAAFAGRGSSPTLRPVAASAVRIESAHLAELRAL